MNASKTPILYWAVYMLLMAVTHSFFNSQVGLLGLPLQMITDYL